MLKRSEMDTQVIEILGRNRLVDELLLAGLEVALPERDRGIDLIAYVDLVDSAASFAAVPIQMKAASARSFVVDKKYERISNLVMAFVWGLQDPDHAQTFALTHNESVAVATEMGWTATPSWERGKYSTSAPSSKLCQLLQPYRMSPSAWRAKISKVSNVAL